MCLFFVIPVILSPAVTHYSPVKNAILGSVMEPEEEEYILIFQNDTVVQISNPITSIKKTELLQITPIFNTHTCNCIDFIKNFYPALKGKTLISPFYFWEHSEEYGFYKTDNPEINDLIVTYEGNPYVGHIGIISDIRKDIIEITDKNYKPCIVTIRELNKKDPIIRGYLELIP